MWQLPCDEYIKCNFRSAAVVRNISMCEGDGSLQTSCLQRLRIVLQQQANSESALAAASSAHQNPSNKCQATVARLSIQSSGHCSTAV